MSSETPAGAHAAAISMTAERSYRKITLMPTRPWSRIEVAPISSPTGLASTSSPDLDRIAPCVHAGP